MNSAEMPQPFGLIFVGPPGAFAVWLVTPDDRLLDREVAELIGQYAVRAGAADYRLFPLEGEQRERAIFQSSMAHGDPMFVDESALFGLQELLNDCGGLPSASHQPLTRE